ncbi:uncharacterized protein LOC111260388 [Varroa jacobsoni]|uniref:Uncharacterized protein n=1 Tax=Varroa destructor TaxID=109461 RepID=A0A7M7KUM5_VARDE|nr:uncharacterized protein LOC111254968 [Varroa destructor]XP_022688831.1 uncharacterized protein LOC111260388 [Varroa jacobsoni]
MAASSQPRPPPSSLDDEAFAKRLRSSYGAAALGAARRYHDFGIQLAEYLDKVAFLSRCINVRLIPKNYKLQNDQVQNTAKVTTVLMKYSKKLMKVDLDHNRLRKEQVEKNLERLMYKMKKIIKCRDDLKLIHSICHRDHETELKKLQKISRAEFRELLAQYRKPVKYTDLAFSDEERPRDPDSSTTDSD